MLVPILSKSGFLIFAAKPGVGDKQKQSSTNISGSVSTGTVRCVLKFDSSLLSHFHVILFFLFRCKLCEQVLLFSADMLNEHLLSCHNSSITKYRDDGHITSSEPRVQEPLRDDGPATPHTEEIECLDVSDDEGNDNGSNAVDDVEVVGEELGMEFTDDLDGLDEETCGICGQPEQYLSQHVHNCHSLSMLEYRVRFPTRVHGRQLFHR